MPAKKPVVKKRSTARLQSSAASTPEGSLNFTSLVKAISQVHEQSAALVNRTVNTTLTLRNWVIGGYIREYEQRGADRAQYGSRLLEKLSDSLQHCLERSYTGRYLGLCRQLFDVYPRIRESVISEFTFLPLPGALRGSASAEIQKSLISESGQTKLPIRRSVTAKSIEPEIASDADQ
jgi:hypothetical protein